MALAMEIEVVLEMRAAEMGTDTGLTPFLLCAGQFLLCAGWFPVL